MTKFMLFILFVIVSFIAACSSPKSESCPCNIKYLHMNSDGTYDFQQSRIDTMTDIGSVSSSIIKVTVNPGNQPTGVTPTAQYMMTSNHTLVPKTTYSSELFSLYKNMEDLYKLDVMIGTNKYLHYPREISLQLMGPPTNCKTDNAFYSAQTDRITVLRYGCDGIPLGINAALISHEHFHAIFENIVGLYSQTTLRIKKSEELPEGIRGGDLLVPKNLDPIRGFNFLILHSLDEGMADFWGYLATGQATPYVASFPASVMGGRTVLENVVVMPDAHQLSVLFDYQRFIHEEVPSVKKTEGQTTPFAPMIPSVHGEIYAYATVYANFFRKMSHEMFGIEKVSTPDDKKKIGQWILKSLLKLKAKLEAKKVNDVFSPVDFVSSFMPNDMIQKSSVDVCKTATEFLQNYDTSTLCK